jgi:hypothetical protein
MWARCSRFNNQPTGKAACNHDWCVGLSLTHPRFDFQSRIARLVEGDGWDTLQIDGAVQTFECGRVKCIRASRADRLHSAKGGQSFSFNPSDHRCVWSCGLVCGKARDQTQRHRRIVAPLCAAAIGTASGIVVFWFLLAHDNEWWGNPQKALTSILLGALFGTALSVIQLTESLSASHAMRLSRGARHEVVSRHPI